MSENVKRRSLMKGAAWATPAVVMAAPAPAFASSQSATGLVLTGDAGVSNDCFRAVVAYDVDPKASGPSVTTEISIQTNNVALTYSGGNAPTVENLTATLYLNAAMDILDALPSEIDVINYGDDGSWSPFVRGSEVDVNGQSFIVYRSTYSGSLIASGQQLSPVDAGWNWQNESSDPDDVARAQGAITADDPASFTANQGALVFSATVDGVEMTSGSASEALAAQGSGQWVSRLTTYAECKYVGGADEDDIVIPCEGYPGAPDPYPSYPGRPVEASSRRMCEAFEVLTAHG